MLFLADQPEARLRDLASGLGVTERTAYGVVADLSEAGYLVKERDGRRHRYHIQRHLPLRDEIGRERSVGELLDLLGTTPSPRAARGRRSWGGRAIAGAGRLNHHILGLVASLRQGGRLAPLSLRAGPRPRTERPPRSSVSFE